VLSPLKVSVVGLALALCTAPAAVAQGGVRAPHVAIPKSKVQMGTPAPPALPVAPWISERQSGPPNTGGPRLPEIVQPAASQLAADEATPAPPTDVLVIPVTTLVIVLLVILIVVAID
jgi:hypothetical protein